MLQYELSTNKEVAKEYWLQEIHAAIIGSDIISSKLQEDEVRLMAEMLASEAVLGRDWDLPEEDAAWANL